MSFSFHLVIPDQSGTRILLVKEGGGWRLPRGVSSDWVLVGATQSWVGDRLGLHIAILRCVPADDDGLDDESGDAFVFTENLDDATPITGSWFDDDAVSSMSLVDDRDREAIRRWWIELRGGAPAGLQPWERSGWFSTARAWIEARIPGVAGVEQYAVWSLSSVLRVDAEAGRSYFKALPDHFRHEAAVTEMLSDRFPDVVPRPTAIDAERGWLLTPDFGDELVGAMEPPYWEGALDALAGIQRRSIATVEELIRSGCRDRRPAMLQGQIDEFVLDGRRWLPDVLVRQLEGARARFRDLCQEAVSAPIPDTLVHGDFHAANVAVTDGRYVIFDWSDACVAHPFIDVATFFHVFGPASTDAILRDHWRDRYLVAWEDLMGHTEAVGLFERLKPLAAMHHAISYRWLLDPLDPGARWQLGSALQDWVARALESLSLDG